MAKGKKKTPAKKTPKTKEGKSEADLRAEAKNQEKPKKEPSSEIMSMRELSGKYFDKTDPRWLITREQMNGLRCDRIFTGIIDIDLIYRPTIASRMAIIGPKSVGKSVLTYIIESSAHRTCRKCRTAILPWLNEKTGEIKYACRCRANDPMVVLHVDIEDSFDPLWAARWGTPTGLVPTEEDRYKVMSNKDSTYWVLWPQTGEETFDFINDALRRTAADLVAIDSLAMVVSREALDKKNKEGQRVEVGIGDERMSSRARLMAQALAKLVHAQITAKREHKSVPTLLWTNQFYLSPKPNPRMDPRTPAGGLKAGYVADQDIELSAKPGHAPGGYIEKAHKYLNVSFKSLKCRKAGTAGGHGSFRIVLDEMKTKVGVLHAGDTDEPDRLVTYLTQIGLYDKAEKTIRCLDKDFKTAKEARDYLCRRDIQYLARYPMFALMLPESARDYLKEESYDYSPWGRHPILDLVRSTKTAETQDSDQGSEPGDAGSHRDATEDYDALFGPEE